MSGFLRRITRSRPADAGEPLQQGRAAETEGAAPTAETPPAGAATPGSPEGATSTGEDATTPQPLDAAGATSGDAATTSSDATATMTNDPTATTSSVPAVAPPAKRSRWGPFRRRSKQRESAPPTPVLLADPSVPAGVEPAEQPLRPPAGRRGRLRRRLRYLRRARELMLRDLGGLLYEVHRSGGGNVEAHATVVGAKVQRIVRLDAEAHAIEAALGAPRGETVVFEPGVGGTCATCGELYGSDARFCANCGTAIGAVAAPKSPEIVSEPARTAFWRRAARPASSDQEGAAEAAGAGEPSTGSGPTAADGPIGERSATGAAAATEGDERAPGTAASDQPAAGGAGRTGEQTATSEPAGDEPTTAEPTTHDASDASDATPRDEDAPDNRHGNQGNGRPGEQPSPPWSPLVSRERS